MNPNNRFNYYLFSFLAIIVFQLVDLKLNPTVKSETSPKSEVKNDQFDVMRFEKAQVAQPGNETK